MLTGKTGVYVSLIKENYKAAKNSSIKDPQVCAGAIRTALEAAVKLLWLKKYNKEPIWVINGKEGFNLYEAVKDSRFSSLFNEIIISDIHVIRRMCNDVLHAKAPFTVGVAQELLARLEKCVEAIQSVIEIDVITKSDVSTQNINIDMSKNISQKQITHDISSKTIFNETTKNIQKGDKIMRSGEIVRVRTNAELLNELFGQNYKAWMKSVYDFGDKRVWMIHLDNQERNGWKNYKINNTIIEENLYPDDLTGLRVDVRPNNLRIVFSKHNNCFVFEGIYKYDKENENIIRSCKRNILRCYNRNCVY